MKILIEDFTYTSSEVRSLVREFSPLESEQPEIRLNYVGYYYSPQLQDCVFILPKVLLNEEDKVFGRISPESFFQPEQSAGLTQPEQKFIYEFSVWIYRAIEVYQRSTPNNGIVFQHKIAGSGGSKRTHTVTPS